ncbi:MAG: glutamate synthase, partial [Psychromonas sp.]|nr:glutamate synthase [Psychromonas sp.]
MKIKQTDMASKADLTHSSGTGAVKHHKPIYQSYLPPCNGVCPAGENIQAWLAFVAKGEYHEAWQELVKNNPLPAVHGRVCYHPCETHCNRDKVDDSVSIHSVERFLGDLALEKGWTPKLLKPATGKKI